MNELEQARKQHAEALTERDRVDHGPGSEGQWRYDWQAEDARRELARAEDDEAERRERAEQEADDAAYWAELAEHERREKQRARRRE